MDFNADFSGDYAVQIEPGSEAGRQFMAEFFGERRQGGVVLPRPKALDFLQYVERKGYDWEEVEL